LAHNPGFSIADKKVGAFSSLIPGSRLLARIDDYRTWERAGGRDARRVQGLVRMWALVIRDDVQDVLVS